MGAFDNLDEHRIDDEKPAHKPRQERHFTAFEDVWANRLMDSGASGRLWALSLVLIRTGFFYDRFPVTSKTMEKAKLSRFRKRPLLEMLEKLGLIEIEWRGTRAPIATPLHLSGFRLSHNHRDVVKLH
jgi:hypothetical protein